MISEATVATERSASYLKRLCHHFQMKVPAEYDAVRGRVQFPMGVCELWAEAEALRLRAEAEDGAALARVKEIVGSHLELFGRRDQLQLQWMDQ